MSHFQLWWSNLSEPVCQKSHLGNQPFMMSQREEYENADRSPSRDYSSRHVDGPGSLRLNKHSAAIGSRLSLLRQIPPKCRIPGDRRTTHTCQTWTQRQRQTETAVSRPVVAHVVFWHEPSLDAGSHWESLIRRRRAEGQRLSITRLTTCCRVRTDWKKHNG